MCKSLVDGLVSIDKDVGIVALMNSVSQEKIVVLMADHANFLKCLQDDVIISGGPPFPRVISPSNMPRKILAVPNLWHDTEGT